LLPIFVDPHEFEEIRAGRRTFLSNERGEFVNHYLGGSEST